MKKLLIYKENGDFVIERINEFSHSTKRFFESEEGLKEGLLAYHQNGILDEHEIEVAKGVQALVIRTLTSEEFQGS